MKPSRSPVVVCVSAAIVAGMAVSPVRSAAPPPRQTSGLYTLIKNAASNRRTLPFRAAAGTDLLLLDQLVSIFDLTLGEDTATGGLLVGTGGQRIILTPGQSLASVAGRIVSMSGPVLHEGRTWYVPVDFLSRALGPATNTRIDVRRGSRLIVVGDLRVPQIALQFDRQGPNGRLQIETRPSTPFRVTRDGSRLTIRFDADALDAGPITGASSDFIAGSRVDGTSLLVELGPAAANFRVSDDRDATHATIDLLAPGVPTTTPARPVQAPASPIVDLSPAGIVRTVVIDPGHGGDDEGAHGPAGTIEKNLTLQLARRLKVAIEGRIGLRVLLTRDADENVSMDRRTEFANNNKADLLLSLHANASVRPEVRGAQVLSTSVEDYRERAKLGTKGVPVPVIGGGTRLIEAVPWDVAQMPHARSSAAFGAVAIQHLSKANVPLFPRPTDLEPLRLLAGSNMPAVIIELGFLSNPDDERALASEDFLATIVDALVGAIQDVRNGVLGPGRGNPIRR